MPQVAFYYSFNKIFRWKKLWWTLIDCSAIFLKHRKFHSHNIRPNICSGTFINYQVNIFPMVFKFHFEEEEKWNNWHFHSKYSNGRFYFFQSNKLKLVPIPIMKIIKGKRLKKFVQSNFYLVLDKFTISMIYFVKFHIYWSHIIIYCR